MKLDFKIKQDEFGYYVSMYRFVDGVEQRYDTCKSMSIVLNLPEKDLMTFFYIEFGSDEKPKNNIMHFSDYSKAMNCIDKMRDVVKKGYETGNIFLAR